MSTGKSDFEMSAPIDTTHEFNDEPIHLITQFYIPQDDYRYGELKYCLFRNQGLKYIETIHLLNERIYSDKELGGSYPKIRQHHLGHRLRFRDIFDYVEQKNLKGYIIFANSDIFSIGNTTERLKRTNLHKEKSLIAQLKMEYNIRSGKYNFGKLVADSQDTWIFHSNFNIEESDRSKVNFEFGTLGCDNKLLYIMKTLGFKLYNDPNCIHTLHIQRENVRIDGAKLRRQHLSQTDETMNNHLLLLPYGYTIDQSHHSENMKRAFKHCIQRHSQNKIQIT